ncbi:wyosine biosynthesis protein TYW1 [Candidatus Nitrososphaera evergladensis SR1]|uniref:S-adenosyl-L-methionine-dependent tRNA 4-demethylwyosine synthase n=1 Tax=Candidatus Nitrososphaera evergladensis SR1 TaxID=1459636 RepID=A0A075MTA7_9ARCH|nr:4-demethylwyosine synthase TYW1 [Candidatus Nitrososphaera evergladensis]AIF84796.1 wyosine biosynthesis protein TYW1 [Candidatus Nitrososphaera evergladensis SR1]
MSCSDEYFSHSTTGEDNNLIQITPRVKEKLKKAKYGVYNHSAVELCHWTKKSFANEGSCYKHKFYGISTHQCMEMTPTAMNCENRCVYCWRPAEFYDTLEMPEQMVDEPEVIVQNLMAERKKLINGFYGNSKNDETKLDESLLPAHYAISLSGEPTMYPKLPQLIKYLKTLKATKSIFLVTNGQEPDMLRRLESEDALPTQIYLSTNASNRKMFLQVNRPRHKGAWERWQDSLHFLSTVDTRTVLRMTIIRGYNDGSDDIKDFAKVMSEGDPHFIEIKSYMHVGMSTQRLERDNMLGMEEVRGYANKLCEKMPAFSVMDESEISRIVVLQNKKRYVDRWIKSYFE